jgi:hypothetical protein
MVNVQLRYAEEIPNAVYLREEIARAFLGLEMLLSHTITLKKYTVPTEDDVVSYVQKKTKKLMFGDSIGLSQEFDLADSESELESLLMGLPEFIRLDIINGNKACIDFIRRHTETANIPQGSKRHQRLLALYGIVPSACIQKIKKEGNMPDPRWYDEVLTINALLDCNMGLRFRAKLLLDNGALPKKEEIDILLKHGVLNSKTLIIESKLYPYRLPEVMDLVYETLQSPEKINTLRDFSLVALNEYCTQPIIAFNRHLSSGMECYEREHKKPSAGTNRIRRFLQ